MFVSAKKSAFMCLGAFVCLSGAGGRAGGWADPLFFWLLWAEYLSFVRLLLFLMGSVSVSFSLPAFFVCCLCFLILSPRLCLLTKRLWDGGYMVYAAAIDMSLDQASLGWRLHGICSGN